MALSAQGPSDSHDVSAHMSMTGEAQVQCSHSDCVPTRGLKMEETSSAAETIPAFEPPPALVSEPQFFQFPNQKSDDHGLLHRKS